MTDYGPGPCEVCGEDLEIHTAKELRKCNSLLPEEEGQRQRWTTSPRKDRTIVQALLEELWAELDTIVEHIMSQDEIPYWEKYSSDYDKFAADLQEYCEWRGQAQGIAYALAVLANPYQPDVDKVRTKAMERWEAGQD